MFLTPYENAKNNLQAEINEWNKDYDQSRMVYCKKCKTSLDDFLNTGFVGCAECYDTFYSYLNNFALDVHGRNKHVGKIPTKEVTKQAKKREAMKMLDLEKAAAASGDYMLAQEYKKRREQLMGDL